MIKHWNRLSREVLKSLSLEITGIWKTMALCNLLMLQLSIPAGLQPMQRTHASSWETTADGGHTKAGKRQQSLFHTPLHHWGEGSRRIRSEVEPGEKGGVGGWCFNCALFQLFPQFECVLSVTKNSEWFPCHYLSPYAL